MRVLRSNVFVCGACAVPHVCRIAIVNVIIILEPHDT